MKGLSYRARKVGADLVHVFAALNMNAQVKGIPKRWLGRERIVTIVDGNATAWTLAEAEDLLATALTEYLARLLLPPSRDTPRRILTPFAGSGSEMIGALQAGWDETVGIEREPPSSP